MNIINNSLILNIGICVAGILVTFAFCIASIGAMRKRKQEDFYLALLLMSSFCVFLFNALAYIWNLEETTSDLPVLWIVISTICTLLLLFFANMYMLYRLKRRAFISNELVYAMAFIYGVLAILFIVGMTQEVNWFFVLDVSGNVSGTTAYIVFNAFEMLTGLFDVALVISCHKELEKSEFLSWTFIFIIPLSFAVLSMLTEFNFNNMSLLLSVVMIYIAIHEKDVAEKNNAETKLAESNAKLMISQIQPHFLYNSLNSIYCLIDENPELAMEAVSTFSDYLRANINSLKSDDPIPFQAELDHVFAYIYLENLRFEDKIHMWFDIKETDFMVPPLSVQPLVENAIKHGLSVRKEEGNLWISTYSGKKYYYVEIKDDGVGFKKGDIKEDDGKSTHVGLSNVQFRIESLVKGELKVISKPGLGTTCIIKIPKREPLE